MRRSWKQQANRERTYLTFLPCCSTNLLTAARADAQDFSDDRLRAGRYGKATPHFREELRRWSGKGDETPRTPHEDFGASLHGAHGTRTRGRR